MGAGDQEGVSGGILGHLLWGHPGAASGSGARAEWGVGRGTPSIYKEEVMAVRVLSTPHTCWL